MTDQPQEDTLDPEALWQRHVLAAEPLTEIEVEAVVAAGITDLASWENRGGNLCYNSYVWPDAED